MKLIDGKQIAKSITDKVKNEIEQLGFQPGLAVFLVGEDEASQVYVRLKEKACKKVGIDFHKYLADETSSEADLLESIDFLNNDNHINGILVQLPLPDGLDEQKVINKLDPKKDVDGFHPESLKEFLDGKSTFVPGLSMGIIRLIEETEEHLDGKEALIIANSEIFSAPVKKLLTEKGLHVTIASPDDRDLQKASLKADVIVIAIGRPKFLTGDMIKNGAILIDVGTTKVDGKLIGDIDPESVEVKASWLTPVPGGVGPVTVAMLLENTVQLAKQQNGMD